MFEFGCAEIQQETAPKFGGCEIAKHLRMVRRARHGAGLYFKYDLSEANEINFVVISQPSALVLDATPSLALEGNRSVLKLDGERILIKDLQEPGAENTMHFVGRANDRECPRVLK